MVWSCLHHALAYVNSCAAVKSAYEILTSIHIYSLSPCRLQDLQTLSDTSRHLYNTYFVKEDPLQHNATYGVIINKTVRRRTGRRPPPPTIEPKQAVKSNQVSKPTSGGKIVPGPGPFVKKEEHSRPGSSGSITSASTAHTKTSLKRDTSDFFRAYTKSKNVAAKAPPNLTRNMTDSSLGNTSEDKDSKPPVVSEDEDESEEEALFLDTNTRTSSKKRSSTGKAERQAKLRKMMDDSDEDMVDAEQADLSPANPPNKVEKPQTTATKPGSNDPDLDPDPNPVTWSDSDPDQPPTPKTKPSTSTEPTPPPPPSPPPGPRTRRRAKRKVTKKRTVKDDEGYLVTREEAVWESFSEDEPVVRAPPPPPPPAPPTAKTQKGKGKGGDIMAFFGKK